MPFKPRGPAPAPKPTIYDGMDDATFVGHLEGLMAIESADYGAIERRVQKTQGAFYDRASRLFMQKTADRVERGTDTSF